MKRNFPSIVVLRFKTRDWPMRMLKIANCFVDPALLLKWDTRSTFCPLSRICRLKVYVGGGGGGFFFFYPIPFFILAWPVTATFLK